MACRLKCPAPDVETLAGTTERLGSRPQRHAELRRLLISSAYSSLQQACDAGSLLLFASKRLERPNVFLCPRLALHNLLCHFAPLPFCTLANCFDSHLVLVLHPHCLRNTFC